MVSSIYRVLLAGMLFFLAGCATSPKSTAHKGGGESSTAAATPTSAGANTAASKDVDQNIVDAYAHYAQGMIYDMEDQPEKAQEELTKAAIADPSNQDLVLDLTQRYVQSKQPEKAQEILLRATARPGASGALFARLAVVDSRLGKEDAAIDAAETAIKRAPETIEGYHILFYEYLQKGKPKDALRVLEQAVKVPNTSAEFNVDLGELYATLEHQAPSEKSQIDADAALALKRASGLNSDNPHLRLRLANDYNMLGDTTNAAKIYVELVDAFSEAPGIRADVRDKLARIYLLDKQNAKAREQLEAIVTENPANSWAYYALGSLAEDEQKLSEAEDYFRRTILMSDDFVDAYFDLARVQINLNQPKQALETLEKAKKNPQYTDAFVPEELAAVAYEKQKDYSNAISHFLAAEVVAKATAPKWLTGDFYFEQGAAYERAGNFDQAAQSFEKSLELAPDFAEALNYLGYMWAEHGIKLDRAHDLIEKAVKLEPKNPAYLDSLGWVLYKMNRSQEALAQEQKAIEYSEPDPMLFDHLGDIYAALKQADKAREAWLKSLALESDEKVRKKVEEAAGKQSP